MLLGPSLGPKMMTGSKQLFTERMQVTIVVFTMVTANQSTTESVINNRLNNGILLGDLSSELFELGA